MKIQTAPERQGRKNQTSCGDQKSRTVQIAIQESNEENTKRNRNHGRQELLILLSQDCIHCCKVG